MCGRYALFAEEDIQEMQAIMAEIDRRYNGVPENMKTGEIFPSNVVPVGINHDGLRWGIMKWGFKRFDDKGLVINARSETAAEKPMFKRAMASGRCIIPASAYYEWMATDDGKVKHEIFTPDRQLLYLAGLYHMEDGAATFVILTRDAAPSVRLIHNRMPVIFNAAARDAWLGGAMDPQDILDESLDEMRYTAL